MHTISQNAENAEIKYESSFSRTATAIETAQFVEASICEVESLARS